jgi:hypothetical protein
MNATGYVAVPVWKTLMIQLLNITGTRPILHQVIET